MARTRIRPGARTIVAVGLAVSSLAGQPGVVAQLTRELHQALKEAGLPPGSIDAIFSMLHEGSVEACLAALE